MPKNRPPAFRKKNIPWYDGPVAITMGIIFFVLVFIFGYSGMAIALSEPEYENYILMPSLLIFLSLSGCYILLIRIIRRIAGKKRQFKKF